MGKDLIDRIASALGYDERRVREMRLLSMLYRGGWRSGTEERVSWVRALSNAQLNGLSTSIVLGVANDRILSTEATLYEKMGGAVMGGHTLDGRDSPLGVIHRVEAQGRPAFDSLFNSEFWSKPVGDMTIRDDLKILPEELREPNFGRPTVKKPEE